MKRETISWGKTLKKEACKFRIKKKTFSTLPSLTSCVVLELKAKTNARSLCPLVSWHRPLTPGFPWNKRYKLKIGHTLLLKMNIKINRIKKKTSLMALKLSTPAHFTEQNRKKSSGSYLRLTSEINLSMKFNITRIKENPYDGVEIEYVSPLHKEKLKKIFWKLPEAKKRN